MLPTGMRQTEKIISSMSFMRMKPRHWVLLIVFSTIMVRLAVYQGYTGSDAANYVEEAHNILTSGYSVAERLAVIPFEELSPSPLFNYQNLRLGFILPNALSMGIFGINEFALSIFPFLCSIILIVSVYTLGREIYSPQAGVVAALFAAFVPQDINLTSTILPHIPTSAFMALSACLFVMALKAQGIKKPVFLMVLSGFAACYAYTIWEFGLFILPVLALFLLIVFRWWRALFSRQFWVLGLAFIAGFSLIFGAETLYFHYLSGEWLLRPRLISRMGKMILDVHPIDAGNIDFLRYPVAIVKSYYFGMFFYFAFAGAVVWICLRFCSGSDLAKQKIQALPVVWLFFLFLYLQWGSSSFGEYTPTFKLVTYLTVLTAPGALLSAHLIQQLYKWCSIQKAPLLQYFSLPITAALVAAYAFTSIGCAVVNHIGNGPFQRDQTKHFAMSALLKQYPPKTIYTDGWTARLLNFAFVYEREIAVFDKLDPYDRRLMAGLKEIKEGYVLINKGYIDYATRAYNNKSYPLFVYQIPSAWEQLEIVGSFALYAVNDER